MAKILKCKKLVARAFVFSLIYAAGTSACQGDESDWFTHHFGDREIGSDAMGQTALVDLDRDGDLDFITGERAGPILWYEYQAAGRWIRHTLGLASPSDVGGAALDVDHDGWIDFVAGGVWYRNPGNPKEAGFTRHTFDENLAAVHDLVVGDLDGDGRPDVITMSDRNDLRWYSIPDPPAKPWQVTRIGDSVHSGISTGDLDGDGDLDLVRSNFWLENRDRGQQWIEHQMTEPWGNDSQPWEINATQTRTADINLDGRLDVVIADGENRDARIAWLEAPSDPKVGNWKTHFLSPGDDADRGAYHSLAVEDFDGDGDIDIFTVEMEAVRGDRPPRWFLWENVDGKGHFVERVILDANLGGHEAVAGDVDGDGDLDICSKLWRPDPQNASGGSNHFDYLENQTRTKLGGQITFYAMGDMPRRAEEDVLLVRQIGELPKDAKFVIHVGDIKSGKTPCDEAVYKKVAGILSQATVPVFIIPGDNEWNDCANPAQAWGFWDRNFMRFDRRWRHRFPVFRQLEHEENFSFIKENVLFVGLNLVGGRVHDAVEWQQRHADGFDWIRRNLLRFGTDVSSLVVFGHADPNETNDDFFDPFSEVASQFKKPILYLHGNGHRWVHNRPFAAQNILRVGVDQGSIAPPLKVTITGHQTAPFQFDRRNGKPVH